MTTRRFATLVGFALACTLSPAAQAGDRPVDTLLVNVTPDAESTPASKQCVKTFVARVRADYVELTRMGETAARARVGKTAGEPVSAWSADDLARLRSRGPDDHDAVLLVDCRPEQNRLDVTVASASRAVTRIELRGVAPTRKRLAVVVASLMRRAWLGFSP